MLKMTKMRNQKARRPALHNWATISSCNFSNLDSMLAKHLKTARSSTASLASCVTSSQRDLLRRQYKFQ